eukprot:247389_1
MNFIQKQFIDIINKLYNKINNQLKNISSLLQKTVEKENIRIESLEKQIYKIYNEQNNFHLHNNTNELNKIKLWLEDKHLEQYYNVFISNGYDDMEKISDITFDELQQIGIKKMGHRKKIIKYAQKINHNVNIKYNHNHSKSAMSPNSVNSSLLYTSHNIWSDDSVSSIPWNAFSQGSNNTNNNNKNQIE